jgi:hypothetical protein
MMHGILRCPDHGGVLEFDREEFVWLCPELGCKHQETVDWILEEMRPCRMRFTSSDSTPEAQLDGVA